MTDHRVLISGAGSIGMRHCRNLQSMGIKNVRLCDPSADVEYTDLLTGLTDMKPDVLFVCSPTKFHMEQALLGAEHNCHLFIEKPLSHTWDNVETLIKKINDNNLTAMVGCNMRFHPGPKRIKEELKRGNIGDVKEATIYTGSYLPDWRPQSDYRKSYSADPVQGGTILDCIHEIDLALWYFGPAVLKESIVESAQSIGLTVDGTADLVLAHDSGITSKVHLSFTEKVPQRFCDVAGSHGNLHWDIGENSIDFNQVYLDEIDYFFECIKQNRSPMGNLSEAAAALQIALEAKKRA